MEKSTFKRWLAVGLVAAGILLCASFSISGAAAKSKAASAPPGDPTAVDTIKQLEQDMGNAMVAGDLDKLNQIYADDWATVGSDGKTYYKQSLLDDFKSGEHKLLSFENGPIDVQVFGDVALAQGGVTEKRTRYGKDVSGEFVWNDLLKKRAGKWVVVRSSAARVESGN